MSRGTVTLWALIVLMKLFLSFLMMILLQTFSYQLMRFPSPICAKLESIHAALVISSSTGPFWNPRCRIPCLMVSGAFLFSRFLHFFCLFFRIFFFLVAHVGPGLTMILLACLKPF